MAEARRRSTMRQWAELRSAARGMRRAPTTAEETLWEAIRGRRVAGAKFRRQHPVGPFIVDFICLDQQLVIEVDGDIHRTQVERDAAREAYLRAAGLRVIRCTNEEVLNQLGVVIARIAASLQGVEP